MRQAQRYVTRRHPEADCYEDVVTRVDGTTYILHRVIDDADQNPGVARILGQSDISEDKAWQSAAKLLGFRR